MGDAVCVTSKKVFMFWRFKMISGLMAEFLVRFPSTWQYIIRRLKYCTVDALPGKESE